MSAGRASNHTTNICHMQYLLLHPAESASPCHLSPYTQEENCAMECFLAAGSRLRVFSFSFFTSKLVVDLKGGQRITLVFPKKPKRSTLILNTKFLRDATLSYFLLILSVKTPKGNKNKAEQKAKSSLTHNNLLFIEFGEPLKKANSHLTKC